MLRNSRAVNTAMGNSFRHDNRWASALITMAPVAAALGVFDLSELVRPGVALESSGGTEQAAELVPVERRNASQHGLVLPSRRVVPDQTTIAPADSRDDPGGGARTSEPGGDKDIGVQYHAWGGGHRLQGSITGLSLLWPD
jgi:hypothetical protein